MIKILAITALTLLLQVDAQAQAKPKPPMGFNPGKLPVVVYKTKKDYQHKVPVILSDDKKTIVSYPAPGDFKNGGANQQPVALHKGYMLDKRGINKNVAFLKMTYEQYAALTAPPSVEELYKMIIDKNPLTDICDCGPRKDNPDAVNKLNAIIDAKKLHSKCKSLK